MVAPGGRLLAFRHRTRSKSSDTRWLLQVATDWASGISTSASISSAPGGVSSSVLYSDLQAVWAVCFLFLFFFLFSFPVILWFFCFCYTMFFFFTVTLCFSFSVMHCFSFFFFSFFFFCFCYTLFFWFLLCTVFFFLLNLFCYSF